MVNYVRLIIITVKEKKIESFVPEKFDYSRNSKKKEFLKVDNGRELNNWCHIATFPKRFKVK